MPVPALSDFFDEGETPNGSARLSAVELHKPSAEAAGIDRGNRQTAIAIIQDRPARFARRLADQDTPGEIAKRLEMLVMGSVAPTRCHRRQTRRGVPD